MGIQFTGLASGIDTQSIISELMEVERMRVEDVEKDQVLAEWKKEAWEDMNSKLYSFYKEDLFDFKSKGTYNQKKLTSSDEGLVSMNTSSSAVRGNHEIAIDTMARGSFLTGDELVGLTNSTEASDFLNIPDGETRSIFISMDNGVTPNEVTILDTDTMSDIVGKIKDLDLDLNVSYDDDFDRLFFSSTATGAGLDISVTGDSDSLVGLGLDGVQSTNGSDASFTYNGALFSSSSNELEINGLSFNILGENGTATISVAQDTEAIYESIKSFTMKYNELMVEMNELTGADSASDYDPLTDDEKSAMTDDDITLWESTIKISLLRRDDKLMSITDNLRNVFGSSSGVNTTDFTYRSFSALGIVTGGYEEKGLLHIEGDEDDSLYGLKDNKLRDAINDDPDAVMELLTALGNKVYEDFASRMKSTTLSSALSFYSDKYMDSQISDYEDDIYDLEDRMEVIEARYYTQFTTMEQAIQRSNSTGEWLAQQLGG